MGKGKIEQLLFYPFSSYLRKNLNMHYVASQQKDSLSLKLSPAPWLVCKFSFSKLFIFLAYTNALAVVLHLSGFNKHLGFGESLFDSVIFNNGAAISAFACVYLSTNAFKSANRAVQVLLILISLVFGAISGSVIISIIQGTDLTSLMDGRNNLI